MNYQKVLAGFVALVAAMTLHAGEAVFYINEDGQPASTISVAVDGNKKLVQQSGFVVFDVNSGSYTAELNRYGEWLGDVDFAVAEGESAEIRVDILGGEPVSSVNIFTPGSEEAATGSISGFLISAETAGAVTNARLSVEGSDIAVSTDDEGYFELNLPRGEYTISIAHPNYGNRSMAGVRVFANLGINMNVEMSMSGDGVIEEMVTTGTYIPNTTVAQTRDATTVLEAVGAEQFSRFGDTNAASALKRVSGVTIKEGKYAAVRGLNPRYSNVLYNRAHIPSPDPSRRVVPLDIFPAALVSNINVRKSGSGDYPADSAGAVIDIISKEAPETREGKFSFSMSYIDGTTGESEMLQKTSGLEVMGFASSDKELSSDAQAFDGTSGSTITGSQAGYLLELSELETEKKKIAPDVSMVFSIGDVMAEKDYGAWSYKFSLRYANEWDTEDSDRATYQSINPSLGTIGEQDEYKYKRVTNDITFSSGVSFALLGLDYSVYSNTLWLRQTQADNLSTKGIRGDNRFFTLEYDYAWREREFLMQQLVGDFQTHGSFATRFDWGVTFANASLYAPDSKSYLFQASTTRATDDLFNPLVIDETDQTRIVGKPRREWTELDDDSIDVNLTADTKLLERDLYELSMKSGFAIVSRQRDSQTWTYNYDYNSGTNSDWPNSLQNTQEITEILTQANFDSNDLELNTITNYQGNYTGEWDYAAVFIQPQFHLFNVFRADLGLRFEDSELSIETEADPNVGPSSIVEATVADDDLYASLNGTYFITDNLQLRAAAFNSVNRPDFREVAPARFVDPVSGDLYRGNPNLVQAEIDNFDMRMEYYFSDSESVSAAFFIKDFTNAIERTTDVVAGSTKLIYSFENAEEAYAQGVEFSGAKEFDLSNVLLRLSGNLSYFDTEVELEDASGNTETRQMQGQPELLANAQLAIDELTSGREYTLVLNYTGESLYAVAANNNNLPDLQEEPRLTMDVTFKQPIIPEQLDFKARIRNLTDSEVEITQGGRLSRKYKPGPEFKVGVSYSF